MSKRTGKGGRGLGAGKEEPNLKEVEEVEEEDEDEEEEEEDSESGEIDEETKAYFSSDKADLKIEIQLEKERLAKEKAEKAKEEVPNAMNESDHSYSFSKRHDEEESIAEEVEKEKAYEKRIKEEDEDNVSLLPVLKQGKSKRAKIQETKPKEAKEKPALRMKAKDYANLIAKMPDRFAKNDEVLEALRLVCALSLENDESYCGPFDELMTRLENTRTYVYEGPTGCYRGLVPYHRNETEDRAFHEIRSKIALSLNYAR